MTLVSRTSMYSFVRIICFLGRTTNSGIASELNEAQIVTPGSQNEILNYWPLIGRQWDQFTVNCHFFRVKSSIVSVIILCLPDSVSFETWDTNLFEAFFAYWVSTSVIKLSFINHIEMFLVRYTNGNFGNRELNQKQPWQVLWLQKPFSVYFEK